jgi:gentisate 1,2-dioxygenase
MPLSTSSSPPPRRYRRCPAKSKCSGPTIKLSRNCHTSTSVDHAFLGNSTTMINGQPFHWHKGDTFIVPLWAWHEHANGSASDEAILFSMQDEPILKAFGLYKEEDWADKRN